MTPFWPEWEGLVTLEICNTAALPTQVLSFETEEEGIISDIDKKNKNKDPC